MTIDNLREEFLNRAEELLTCWHQKNWTNEQKREAIAVAETLTRLSDILGDDEQATVTA
jgi:hypothetical protein